MSNLTPSTTILASIASIMTSIASIASTLRYLESDIGVGAEVVVQGVVPFYGRAVARARAREGRDNQSTGKKHDHGTLDTRVCAMIYDGASRVCLAVDQERGYTQERVGRVSSNEQEFTVSAVSRRYDTVA